VTAAHDWSKYTNAKGERRDCSACDHAGRWKGYAADFRVCNQPDALRIHGGPRSCADIVRAPIGACGPTGEHWRAKGVKARQQGEQTELA
jgi:hypothetical protein